jgi:hypothetical protein
VGHGDDVRVAAQRGGLRAGIYGLGVVATGFAQVGVQVDQPGQQHQPVAVDHLITGQAGPDLGNHPAVEHDVNGGLAVRPDTAK